MVQTVQKTVEVPQLQFIDKVVDIPVVAQRQIPMVQTVQKTIEIPQLQYVDKVVDVPVVQVVQVPQVQVVEKTVEIPQLQIVEKIVEIPEIQTVQGTQTSESLGTAPVRQVAPAGICGGGRDRSASARRIRTTHVRHCTRLGSSSSC